METSPIVAVIYANLSLITAILLVHSIILRKKLSIFWKKLHGDLISLKEDHLPNDQEKSETLTWYVTHYLGKKTLILRLQDKVQNNFFIGFLFIMAGFVVAPVIVTLAVALYSAFGIDLATMFIIGGFVVYLYMSEYPELRIYGTFIDQLQEVKTFSPKDEEVFQKAFVKLKLLQSNLIVLLPLFVYCAFNYDVMLSTAVGFFGWTVLHVQKIFMAILLPIGGTIIDDGYVYLASVAFMLILIFAFVPRIGKLWKMTGTLRLKLIP